MVFGFLLKQDFVTDFISSSTRQIHSPELARYNLVCTVRDLNFIINKELYKKTDNFLIGPFRRYAVCYTSKIRGSGIKELSTYKSY